MSCECRNKCTKIEANWGQTQADRPLGLALDPNATSLILGQGNTFTLILRYAIKVGLIRWTERPQPWMKGPTCMQDSGEYLRTAFLGDMQALISKTVQQRDETR
jgi:hypothetical protein